MSISVSEVSERLAAVADQLPERIAIKRETTIKQAMENITRLTMSAIDETAKKSLAMVDATTMKASSESQAAIDRSGSGASSG